MICIIAACSILIYHVLIICLMLVRKGGVTYILTHSFTNHWTAKG